MNKKIALLLSISLMMGAFNYSFGEEKSIRTLFVKGNESECLFLEEFTKVENLSTKKYLKEFTVFAVRECVTFKHPTGHFNSILIPNKGTPIFFNKMSEAAAFLSKRIGKVETKEKAKEVMLLLPEIFSYKVITAYPAITNVKELTAELNAKNITKRKREKLLSLIEYHKKLEDDMNKKRSDWNFVFETTKTGWSLTCSLLFDSGISLCKRVTISIDRSGKLNVSKTKNIYSPGAYM